MTVDEQLRETLHRRANGFEPSLGGWTAIAHRIERRQARTRAAMFSLVGGFSLAAVAVAVMMVTMAVPDTVDQDVAATGGAASGRGSTTTIAFASGPPTTAAVTDLSPGQIAAAAAASTAEGGSAQSGPTPPAAGPNLPDTGILASGFHSGTIYPETAAALENTQAQVDAGHQPWWVEPEMVATSYLADRGLVTDEDGAPRSLGEIGALRYTAGGVGGWVSLGQHLGGSIFYVEGSRSDRIVHLRVVRQGDRLAVDVLAATGGKVVVRAKRPGTDWYPSTSATVAAGKPASLTVEGPANTELIVQVRHEGDDGRVGLSEQLLGQGQARLEYEGLHDGSPLGPMYLGPVTLGQTLAEAERMAGIEMTVDAGEYCTGLSPAGRPAGVTFVSTAGDGRVNVITVAESGVRTEAGIGVGSTVADVRRAYPGVEERMTGSRGRLVWKPSDPMLQGYEIIFDIANAEVRALWAGSAGLSATDEICA